MMDSKLYLYNLTLQRSTAISIAISGHFSGGKVQEIALAKGHILELVRPDPLTGKIQSLLSVDVFGIIRSMIAFRLTGGLKDYIIIGSDSGRIVILEYNPNKNCFDKVHQETFGKSGCRRIVPGQYLAMDPKGRAVMISAIEKQKLVFILNRDSQARLTISSPLEAHKSRTFIYHTVGVDVGFENPIFACLEIEYEDVDEDCSGQAGLEAQQFLTFYELDLGLNHVVRKYSEPLEEQANFLISVPGGVDGPSGVLLCSENYITYKNFGDQPDVRCPIPRRINDVGDPKKGILLTCAAFHKTKSLFFFLVQTENGDLFKVTLDVEEDIVTEIKIKYFDTVSPAQSICILRTGFLFVASEFGDHYLYQIIHLADNDNEEEFGSSVQLDDGETFRYSPRDLINLVLIDELPSLSPIMNAQISDIAREDTPQMLLACGRGPRSTFRVLRHGLQVGEMAVSDLPGNPTAVWTVKKKEADSFDSYIVVSFSNATLVLQIGDNVEEITDSGFQTGMFTIACAQVGQDSLVQIHSEGIRHIRADKRVNEWRTPGRKQIVKAAINQKQVVIALSGGEIVYFEMDISGQLNEYTERKDMNAEVICMSLGEVPNGQQRSRFLAIGLSDNTIRIISLDPATCLAPLPMQTLPARPESIAIVEMGFNKTHDKFAYSQLYLNVGLNNGVHLRTKLDEVTGDLSDTRTRYLGTRPIKLFPVKMDGRQALLAISSRAWLCYYHQNRLHLTPLSYEMLEYASSFSSDQCPEGIVAIANNTLRILSLENLGDVFNQQSMELELTPRKFVINPDIGRIVLIETDHNAMTQEMKQLRKQQMAENMIAQAPKNERNEMVKIAQDFLENDLPESIFGSPQCGDNTWSSLIRLIDPLSKSTIQRIPLEQNQAAISMAFVRFSTDSLANYIVVGLTNTYQIRSGIADSYEIQTYRFDLETGLLQFIHRTEVEDVPRALTAFQGKVLVGVGKMLRLYDLGKQKLLKKCENKSVPGMIITISTMGDRIYVGDIDQSLFFFRYARSENSLILFADDTMPRFVTSCCAVDYNTVAIADKFGTISLIRIHDEISDEAEDDPTGIKSLWDRGLLGGCSQKFDSICNFYLGDIVLSLNKATLIPGLSEALVYTTISGSIGVLVPFTSTEDHAFFQHLEMHMRGDHPPLCGRDHLAYRSSIMPIKNVIDGDLCEQFNMMEYSKQLSIAQELDREPAEVSKKLEDMRTRYAF